MLNMTAIRERRAEAQHDATDLIQPLINDINDLLREVAKVPPSVWELMDRHAGKWGERPTSYWFYRLSEEVGELGSSLAGHPGHLGDGPMELELAEIASICINWLRRKNNA